MKRKTIKELEATIAEIIKERDEAIEGRRAFRASVRSAVGMEREYSASDDEIIKKAQGLEKYRQMHEGTVSVQVGLLREELDRVWHLVRLYVNDKLLGLSLPGFQERHHMPATFIDGKPVEPPPEPLADTFRRPDMGPRF